MFLFATDLIPSVVIIYKNVALIHSVVIFGCINFLNLSLSIYIYISSSSSYRAGSTDIPDPLSPLLPIVHRPR